MDHRSKLDWARKHLDALNRISQEFCDSNPYVAVSEFNADTGENILRLASHKNPPAEFSPLVGDTLFNMKASLDYLVHALAVKNGSTRLDQTEFPIYSNPLKYADKSVQRRIQDLAPIARAEIEKLQPYHGQDPSRHPLM